MRRGASGARPLTSSAWVEIRYSEIGASTARAGLERVPSAASLQHIRRASLESHGCRSARTMACQPTTSIRGGSSGVIRTEKGLIDMKTKIVMAVGLVLAVAAGAYAQSGWMQNSPVRTMMAPADVTCYSIEPWFSLASVNTNRPDILATFTRTDGQGRITQLCFLRVQSEVGEWAELPAK
jgi:hypothetical protein